MCKRWHHLIFQPKWPSGAICYRNQTLWHPMLLLSPRPQSLPLVAPIIPLDIGRMDSNHLCMNGWHRTGCTLFLVGTYSETWIPAKNQSLHNLNIPLAQVISTVQQLHILLFSNHETCYSMSIERIFTYTAIIFECNSTLFLWIDIFQVQPWIVDWLKLMGPIVVQEWTTCITTMRLT